MLNAKRNKNKKILDASEARKDEIKKACEGKFSFTSSSCSFENISDRHIVVSTSISAN